MYPSATPLQSTPLPLLWHFVALAVTCIQGRIIINLEIKPIVTCKGMTRFISGVLTMAHIEGQSFWHQLLDDCQELRRAIPLSSTHKKWQPPKRWMSSHTDTYLFGLWGRAIAVGLVSEPFFGLRHRSQGPVWAGICGLCTEISPQGGCRTASKGLRI